MGFASRLLQDVGLLDLGLRGKGLARAGWKSEENKLYFGIPSPKPLKIEFFGLKTPGIFRDFLGEQFALIESSGDPNLTNFMFFPICDLP